MKSSPAARPNKSPNPVIWKLGTHRLACGDATDCELVAKLLGSEKIDAIITDPPYGVAYADSKSGFSKIKVDKEIANDGIVSGTEYAEFTKRWLMPAVERLAKKNSVYIFNSDKMLFVLKSAMDAAGIRFSQLLVWIKSQPVVGRKDYLPQHELIAFGWHGTHAFRRSKDKSVIFCPKPAKNPLHPTQKPVALIRKLVLNSVALGGAVYDPFAGSGTTVIACEQTRRRCFTVELDPEYCRTIISRWEKLTGQTAQKI